MDTHSTVVPDDGDEEWEDEDTEEEKEIVDDDGDDDVDDDSEYVSRSAKRALKALEEELGTTKGLLRRNAKILYCDALFEEPTSPRTVETLARINSPTRNKYIEVHFSYHSRRRMYSVEWLYTLGYKVFPSTRTAETDIEIFRERPPATKYSRRGWHGISYACYDDENNYGRTWKRIEVFSVDVTPAGLIEAHTALWGPLAALPPDASAADLLKRRRALIRTFRVLLASVGIEYTIACKDDEIDSEPGGCGSARWEQIAWVLEAARDRWLARGVREACGFQLERDPEDEWRGIRNREEEARGFDDDDDDDSDEEDYY